MSAAGEIRVLTSPRLISEVMDVGYKGPITIADVLEVLRLQISVVECDVFAYPTIESDIIILIMAVNESPTTLQVRWRALSHISDNTALSGNN